MTESSTVPDGYNKLQSNFVELFKKLDLESLNTPITGIFSEKHKYLSELTVSQKPSFEEFIYALCFGEDILKWKENADTWYRKSNKMVSELVRRHDIKKPENSLKLFSQTSQDLFNLYQYWLLVMARGYFWKMDRARYEDEVLTTKKDPSMKHTIRHRQDEWQIDKDLSSAAEHLLIISHKLNSMLKFKRGEVVRLTKKLVIMVYYRISYLTMIESDLQSTFIEMNYSRKIIDSFFDKINEKLLDIQDFVYSWKLFPNIDESKLYIHVSGRVYDKGENTIYHNNCVRYAEKSLDNLVIFMNQYMDTLTSGGKNQGLSMKYKPVLLSSTVI